MPPMKRLTGGKIAGLYVGNNKGTVKRPVCSLLLTLDGMEGDAHAGRTQKTGAREPAFRRGTMVANSSKQLFDFIGRIESLEAERTEAGDKIKAEKALAKAAGFDMKAFNQLLKERKGDMIKTMQNRAIVETYRRALGQYADNRTRPVGAQFHFRAGEDATRGGQVSVPRPAPSRARR